MNTVPKNLGLKKTKEIADALREGTLIDYLKYLVRKSYFHHDDETHRAYEKVATFLEDGWQSQRQYTELEDDISLSLDELGRAMNQIVGGTRYEKAKAEAIGCRWTAEGSWPTRADVGAFLFYSVVKGK